MSQGTGEVACPDSRPGSQGGIWGSDSHGGTDSPPKQPELGCSTLCVSPPQQGAPMPGGQFAPMASCGPPRGGGGRILTPAPQVEGCAGSL